MITQQRLKQLFSYNPETGVFVRLVKTNSRARAGTVAGTLRPDGYLKVQIDKRPYMLHRLAWLYMTGHMPPDWLLMDHKNQIKTDNRWDNLRLADHSQNGQNIRQVQGRENRTSEHRGVHWDGRRQKWFAQIALHGRKKFIGRFNDEASALAAYEAARDTIHPFRPANENVQDSKAA